MTDRVAFRVSSGKWRFSRSRYPGYHLASELSAGMLLQHIFRNTINILLAHNVIILQTPKPGYSMSN